MEPIAEDNQYNDMYKFICEYSDRKNLDKGHKIVQKYKKKNINIIKGIENFELLYKSMENMCHHLLKE